MCTRNYESKKIKTIYLAACSSKYEYREGDSTPFFISWPNSETIDLCSRDISLCLVCWSAKLPAIFFSYNKPATASQREWIRCKDSEEWVRMQNYFNSSTYGPNCNTFSSPQQKTLSYDDFRHLGSTPQAQLIKYSARSHIQTRSGIRFGMSRWNQSAVFFYFFRDRA